MSSAHAVLRAACLLEQSYDPDEHEQQGLCTLEPWAFLGSCWWDEGAPQDSSTHCHDTRFHAVLMKDFRLDDRPSSGQAQQRQ